MANIVKADIANALNSLTGILGTADQIADISTGFSIQETINEINQAKADKTEIPTQVSQLENDASYGTYTMPNDGIPRSDLSSEIQTSLRKADSAAQNEYLTFTALSSGTITITASNASNYKTVYYSLNNGETWSQLTTSLTPKSFGTFSINSTLLLKGTNVKYASDSEYTYFGGTAKVKISGNIMSLVYGDDFFNKTFISTTVFTKLFYNYTNLVDAKDLVLPAIQAYNNTYESMFEGCSSLIAAPELPAIYVEPFCYHSMFKNCTSLLEAPELPARKMTQNCYSGMFYGCTSLIKAPELPSTTLADSCYSYMFAFCTSLTTAPVLPAQELVTNCYECMFIDCHKLNYIKALCTIPLGNTVSDNWVDGVSDFGTFIKSTAATWDSYGIDSVPNGWTVYDERSYSYALSRIINLPKINDLIYNENNYYIEKQNNVVLPLSHPDLSTQPSILPERFGKYLVYEVLIPIYTDVINFPSDTRVSLVSSIDDFFLCVLEGSILKKDTMIISASLLGRGVYDNPTIIKNSNRYCIYTSIPISNLGSLDYLLIKYTNISSNSYYYDY